VTSLERQIADLALNISVHLNSPRIDRVVLPERMLSDSELNAKHDKFGLVVLDNGSAGFFYRLLDVQPELTDHYRQLSRNSAGLPLSSCIDTLKSDDLFERGIAWGAISALTATLFDKASYKPPVKTARQGQEIPQRVGMVGYFSEQARQLVATGHELSVLELNPALSTRQPHLTVSANPAVLRDCQVIYCTASTLINGSLDSLLQNHAANTRFELVGPSAGCCPDPLFSRHVDVIGGSLIKDVIQTEECIISGQPWRQSVQKFSLEAADYPGTQALLESGSKEH